MGKCHCCTIILQLIIFLASGFDSVTLIGWDKFGLDKLGLRSPIPDNMKGQVIMCVAILSWYLAIFKLIIKESCLLCCKYSCLPYTICCCNNKQINSPKNVKAFWLSFADVYFDLINGLFLVTKYELGDTDFLVIIGTSIGFGSELLELISEVMGVLCYSGNCQLIIALFTAIIGIIQIVLAKDKVDSSKQYIGYMACPYYATIIFAILYAFCQIDKAKKQEKIRKSTVQSAQLATVQVNTCTRTI
eukprot:301567_1